MTNYLRQAANVLQDRMERDAAEPVDYKADTGEWVAQGVLAIVGQTTNEETTDEGFVGRISTRDFTIRIANLGGRKPKRYDKIYHLGDEYLVVADSGESHYVESDGYSVAWRIHTKRNSSASTTGCTNRA